MLYLITGAILSAIAALAHIGCILFGAKWYRFFGAGEKMAKWADEGNLRHIIITTPIVLILAMASVYAMSGAGVILPLPLLKWALVAIMSVNMIRGIVGFYFVVRPYGENSAKFWFYSSAICLGFGIVHLIGLLQVWQNI